MKLTSKHCVSCGSKGTKKYPLERHHIFPKCHYGAGSVKTVLCAKCHDQLEDLIEKHEGTELDGRRHKRDRKFYTNCLYKFLEANKCKLQ